MLKVFDIFSFVFLVWVGFYMRKKKKKASTLLVLSLALVSVSAFFFTSKYISIEETKVMTFRLDVNFLHYDLYGLYFLLTWMVYFYIPYLLTETSRQEARETGAFNKDLS